jgi:NAD(P) transhydrogenase subunit alpha
MFPMLMTAAGTIAPARVFVVGAGVAGLQAIAAARRFGAVVSAYDVRPAVKEQVESLGARFVELAIEAADAEEKSGYAKAMDEPFYRRERELMPGKKAPVLITEEMVAGMQPGSVIVDVAAERGGNCQLTEPGKTVVMHGVTIIGPLNLASSLAYHASQLYSRNIATFLLHLVQDGTLALDAGDRITQETLLTHDGRVVHPQIAGSSSASSAASKP